MGHWTIISMAGFIIVELETIDSKKKHYYDNLQKCASGPMATCNKGTCSVAISYQLYHKPTFSCCFRRPYFVNVRHCCTKISCCVYRKLISWFRGVFRNSYYCACPNKKSLLKRQRGILMGVNWLGQGAGARAVSWGPNPYTINFIETILLISLHLQRIFASISLIHDQ